MQIRPAIAPVAATRRREAGPDHPRRWRFAGRQRRDPQVTTFQWRLLNRDTKQFFSASEYNYNYVHHKL
jgi:hypothetical protein